ncbi:CsxC family protein, partial [Desulforamulus aeronauticus]
KEAEQPILLADDAPPEAEDHPDNSSLPRTVVQKNLFDEYWKTEQPLIVIDDVYPDVDDHTDNASPPQTSIQEGEEKETEQTPVIIDHAYPQVDCHSDNSLPPQVSIQEGEEKEIEQTPVIIDHAYPQVDCHSDNSSPPQISIQEGEEKETEQPMVATDISHTGIDCHPNNSCPTCVSVTSSTVTNCESNLADTPVITAGALTKIPVVLAQFQVQLNINARIDLPQPALEIKEILSSTKLIQSLLLLEPEVVSGSGNLFLKGFIRKNISYATSGCFNKEGVCGDIRHCTVDVPFSCTTVVTYDTPPVLPVSNSMAEFQFFRSQKLNHGQFAEKDQLLSSDMSEHNQVSVEYFNELPYCELISSRIVQYDEFLNRQKVNKEAPFEEHLFTRIEEKMILTLTVKLLQKQSVQIPPAPGLRYLDTSDDTSISGNENFDLFELADSKSEAMENHVNEEPKEVIEEFIIIDKDIGVVTEKSYQAVANFLENQEQGPGG